MARGSRQQTIPQNQFNTKQAQPINGWDDLQKMAADARGLIMSTEGIRQFVYDETLRDFLEDKSMTAQLIQRLGRDVKDYVDRFNQIYQAHRDRTGKAVDENEHMATLDLALQYFDLSESFRSVVLPTYTELMEHYLLAGERREAARNNTPVEDSNND